ncbi:MAG TPA: hypothetical protein PL079_04365 [Tenuifilaceae bacterium]|nr:hypothetical protein [Tenuifilaceae bacterium]
MKIKLLFVNAMLIMAVLGAKAQNAEQPKKIPSTYDRSSITFLYMKVPGENHVQEVESKIGSIVFSDKFYNNNMETLSFDAPFSRTSTEVVPQEAVKKYLTDQKVAKSIISLWYNRQEDGSMSMDKIFDRGMFNATDAAYIKAQSTKLGNAVLQDYGSRLVGRSYIMVLDYQNVKTMQEAKINNMHGWQATAVGYLYKINYTEETQNALYDCWIYPEDSPAVKAEKIKKFEQLEIPLEFVTKTSVPIVASQPNPDTQIGRFIKQKSDDVLLQELVQKGYDETIYNLEKSHEDFMVKTTIHQVNPIRVKIGKKEGLKCDHRYFAYEYVYNEKTNTTEPRFRGVIRATSKIVDNRQVATGEMPTSTFYQTAGRKLQTGYLVRQQNDMGLEVLAGFEMGEVGGVYGRADFRLGRFVGIRSLFVFGEVGFQTKEYDILSLATEDVSFTHYGAGIAKGFMLTRNVELRPYVGIGQESATSDAIEAANTGNYTTLYLRLGGNLALNLKHNIQLMGGIGTYSFISNASNDNGDLGVTWDEVFPDRGGVSTLLGVKIMF